MNQAIRTKELAILAMIAAVIGVVFTLMDYAYMPLSAVLGTVFMELTFGIYLLSAALPMYLSRKPGMALFGAMVTAGVNLLLGSPYGIQLVLAGALQALGVEIAYFVVDRYQGSMKNLILGGLLGAICVFARDMIVWNSPLVYGVPTALGIVVVRLVSATVICTLFIKLITAALLKTGVLKGFACAKK